MYNRQSRFILRSILSTHYSYSNAQYLSTSSSLKSANYYQALGIVQSSTQSEIKSAYYKLSMQYHPDKNKGCENSAKKFREITQAYEVLGNYRLRRLYDKGIIHTAGSTYAQPTEHEPEEEDDPETKFYKSRFKKSKVSDEMGRTPIYDFDEWSRAHYGKSFQRRQDAKQKFDRKKAQNRDHVLALQNEMVLFGLVFLAVVMYAVFYTESSLDTPKERAIRAAEKMKTDMEGEKSIMNANSTSPET
ncbi:dnaJ homolog subfamily C member 30, mitochondrial-like [Rhagoletis pomonella]|uniref:dnaJ homolog subfamily C member 30, mitochondrial-like n=1 Tax=Rhagoletis pomonella TaxID=28610 RepID=UPI00177FD439|nr:dnaJ homolog subfamily C member 30, mitochondrial-like [Rhagoletis pomonella]